MVKHLQIIDGRLVPVTDQEGEVQVYVNPSEEERRHLVNDFTLDEHTMASSLDPDELSRLEFEPDHLALIFKRPRNYSSEDNFLFNVASTGMFLFKDRLIIVVAEDVQLFNGKLFTRLQSVRDVVLKMIYRSIFHFLEHLRVINAISDSLEQKINASMENRYLLNLFTLEKSLVYYLNAIHSNGVLVEKLKNSAQKIGFAPESIEFLDDILIENNQCYRQAEIYSNILASMMDARASIVSNNLNVLMKTLTIITIMIMMPTLVVSAFSMNVSFPLRDNSHAFWIVIGLALSSGFLVFLLYLRSKKR